MAVALLRPSRDDARIATYYTGVTYMFIAYDLENGTAFGPFLDAEDGVRFFLDSTKGQELLGIDDEGRDRAWGAWDSSPNNIQRTIQDFREVYSLVFVEVQHVEA